MWPIAHQHSLGFLVRSIRIQSAVVATIVATFSIVQPTRGDLAWQFDPGVGMFANAQASATVLLTPQAVADTQLTFMPNFAVGPDIYDYGNAALASSTQSGGGWSLASSGVSVLAVTGVGTSTAQVYFRVSTLDDASNPPPPWETNSNASLLAFLPLEIAGGPPDTSYHVQCDYEYFANALTQPEFGHDDRARTSAAVFLGNGVGGNWVPFVGYFDSENVPPYGTGGTITGNLPVIAGTTITGQLPLLNVQFNPEAQSFVSPPGIGIGGNDDLSGAEFVGKITLTIGSVCNRPTINTHPVLTLACPTRSATFTVAAAGGGGPYAYQWQYDSGGQNWVNQDDGPFYGGGAATVSGATTDAVTISNVDVFPATAWRCIVSNACGPTASNSAPLSMVLVLPGDVRVDFQRNGRDIQAFVNVLMAGAVGPAGPARCAADINHDGMVDALDVPLLVGILMAQ